LTLNQTLLVIWAIVILMLSWLRSPILDGRNLVGILILDGYTVAPSILVPSDGVFGHFDLVAHCGCHTLNVCLFVLLA
jgi:hypothetical protein